MAPTPVWAKDPVEEARIGDAENLLARLADWSAAGAARRDDIERSLPKLVKSHNELETGAVRAKLQKAAGALLKNEELGATRMVVADSLGRLNDPRGAWAQLKRFVPSVKDEAAGPFPLRVVQAVGALAPEQAISTLTQLMEKAKDNNVARFAIQALGKYGWSKQRTKVLGSLLEFLRRLRPGGSDLKKGRAGGEAARVRYQFLQQTLVAALIEITGRKEHDSVDKWLAAYKEHKKSLPKLFTFER